MNPPRDTDEGRARPSVWPVYLAAVVVGVGGLAFLSIGIWDGLAAKPGNIGAREVAAACGLWGALGIVAAGGLFRLRPWAWRCAVAWTGIFIIGCGGWALFSLAFVDEVLVPQESLWGGSASAVFAAFWYIAVVLLPWALVTRRQLFFPPKPEGEE